MKKKNWKRKTVFLFPLIAIILGLTYLAMGCPVFTAEQAFRRAEAKSMLGPGTILGTEAINCNDYGRCYDTLIVAETEHGVMLYSCDLNKDEQLYYREKKGPLTIMALPNGGWSWLENDPRQLNVVLFDDFPQAVRAEVEIDVNWPKDFYGFTPEGVSFRCDLEALRDRDGYFRFVHTIYGSDYIDNDNVAMRLLTDLSCKREVDEEYYLELKIPATVRLYDQDNNLILEETLELRSIGAEEREKLSK